MIILNNQSAQFILLILEFHGPSQKPRVNVQRMVYALAKIVARADVSGGNQSPAAVFEGPQKPAQHRSGKYSVAARFAPRVSVEFVLRNMAFVIT